MKNTYFFSLKMLAIAASLLFSSTKNHAQSYCTPSTSGLCYVSGISALTLTGVADSVVDTNSCTTGGYMNLTGLSCTVFSGRWYRLSVTPVAVGYAQSQQVWVDFNSNGTFEASETVGGVASVLPAHSMWISLPASVATGTYRMRFVTTRTGLGYSYSYPTLDPCLSGYYFGEARDYSLNVIGGIPSIYDSFLVYPQTFCASTNFTVQTYTFASGLTIHTDFGDGTSSFDTVTPGFSTPGTALISHGYATNSTFSVKQVLYAGSVATDSVRFSYNHLLCNTKRLTFYFDANGNCSMDPTDPVNTKSVTVEIDSNGTPIDTLVATGGLYYEEFGSAGDVYQYRMLSAARGFYFSCPSSGIVTDTMRSSGLSSPNSYVGLACITGRSINLSINNEVIGTGRHMQEGNIYAHNNSCFPTTSTVELTISPKYVFASANPMPTSEVGNTVTWTLPSSNHRTKISYLVTLPPTRTTYLTIGDTVHTTVSISPIAGDVDTTDNIDSSIDTVRSSFDPNEITVSPAGNILSGARLRYKVQFENTGNDTAYNIHVMDTLSDDLDPSTLRIVTSSAAMYITYLHDSVGHTVLKFEFPDIKLADSSHHGFCDGMVIYEITSNRGLADGTVIPARAGIYFDCNEVVLTNIATNTVRLPHIYVSSPSETGGCLGSTVQFAAEHPGIANTQFRWKVNGIAAGSNVDTFATNTLANGDVVSCLLWDAIGDTLLSTSNNLLVTINDCPEKIKNQSIKPLSVYPNPNHGACVVSLPNPGVPAEIIITDIYGKLIQSVTSSAKTVEFTGLEKGTYALKILQGGLTYRDKITVW